MGHRDARTFIAGFRQTGIVAATRLDPIGPNEGGAAGTVCSQLLAQAVVQAVTPMSGAW